jgi:hypothetical protein
MAMKNIAGQPVRDNNFFDRPVLSRQFQQKIESGSSILISAPRRVGKTSLMLHVHDQGMEGYYFIYLITESVNNENEYFKRLLNKIFETKFLTYMQKFSKKSHQSIKDRIDRISEIGKTIKFDSESKRNFREEFIDIIKSIDLKNKKIIFLIDEFSQTVENIIEDEGKNSAIRFLQGNRELRQDPDVNQKIQFVYAGSIGLENIVSHLNSVHLVNDLDPLKVPPLSGAEAHRLMQELSDNKPFALNKHNRDYILEKIQWYIPFYIQLAVMVISDLDRETGMQNETVKIKITKKFIDQAFDRMLELRSCFEHWHMRLRKAFKKEEYNFAKEILNFIANEENIERKDMLNLAQKFNIPHIYKDIVNALVYDGYINNNDDPGIYRFNSPILMMWWRKNVAN